MERVPNERLRREDVPVPEADWYAQSAFAHCFDGYQELGRGPLATLANRASRRFRDEGALPATLTELRACLFYEHRRAVHFGGPTDEMRAYAAALLAAIRAQLAG